MGDKTLKTMSEEQLVSIAVNLDQEQKRCKRELVQSRRRFRQGGSG